MTTARVSRISVASASVLFAALALTIWLAPAEVARELGVQATRATGLVAVRAELGGLFAGLAMLCGAAAWSQRRSWTMAALAVLAAIVASRLVAWSANPGAIVGDLPALVIELTVMAALIGLTRPEPQPAAQTSSVRAVRVAAMLLVVPAVGGAAFLSPSLQQRIVDRAGQQRAATVNTAPLEDDALRVAVCGSSAPLPSASRAKACVAVFAGGKFYLVDVGPESVENLVLWGIPLQSVGGVFLTHFHSDHIGDLGELNLQTWAGGRAEPLSVYGGPGVERVVAGFNQAYQLDQGYRTAHHTARVMPPTTWPMIPRVVELQGPETPAKDRSALVFDDGALRVIAFEVNHAPIAPAYAYRFDYKGRSVLVTGDLKYHPPLVKAAEGVDVLVSEAIALSMTRALGSGATDAGRSRTAAIMHDIEDYHITPEQASQIANEAHARLLVFYHLLPSPDGVIARRVFSAGISEARHGDWAIADDGDLYTLPLGSTDVRIGRVGE